MRRFRWFIVLVSLAFPLFIIQFTTEAAATLRVNEEATRFFLEAERTEVSLAVENPTGDSLPAHVRLELLDTEDVVRATAERDEPLQRGANNLSIRVPLDLSLSSQSQRNELLWYRLRYRITPASDASRQFAIAEGIISLSEITPDIFELRVAAPAQARPGMRCRVHVSAIHPISSRPVNNVKVEAAVEYEAGDETQSLKATGVTDAEGFVALDFDLPRNIDGEEYEIELKVNGRRGAFTQEAEEDIELDNDARILIMTDKPLYQPGQTLHIRALVFDASRHALADAETSLVIEDPEGSTVYRASMKTSRFGTASSDWAIPENIRLGDYRLLIEAPHQGSSSGEALVKISRYDLPNFVVKAKPDQPYYLPGQQAEVEVSADYLFGQPVKRGRGRVVRESSRHWSYQEQKVVTEEGEKYEGETDAEGRYIAHINLQNELGKLAADDYERYRDISYAAYFTDPTTNRTEQRRFDLRVTKDAIHIYIDDNAYRQTANFPLDFYVSANYADGTPAECEIAITSQSLPFAGAARAHRTDLLQMLGAIKTNRYGLAKVSGLSLTGHSKDEREATLVFLARDAEGRVGRQSNSFSLSQYPALRVETDKIIYRPGEAIQAQLTASEPGMRAAVNVWQRGVVVRSLIVQFKDGRAAFTIPYSSALKDDVTVSAYPLSTVKYDSYDMPLASRTVLFPRESDLKLSIQLDQKTYRPGQDARADFTVRAPDGRAVESALGVVVFDRAVEERARTDREFGGSYGFYNAYRYLHGSGEMSGVSLSQLEHLDLSKPVPRDLELAAEMLLSGQRYVPKIFQSEDYDTNQSQIFAQSVATRTKPLTEALMARYLQKREYPRDEESLRRMLGEGGIAWEAARDPWGIHYRAEFSVARELDYLILKSAGADKRFDTPDDFNAVTLPWPYFNGTGETLKRTIEKYHERTRDYLRDEATLKAELSREGLDANALIDHWGQPYTFQFGISGTYYTLTARSGGPNGKFERPTETASDDFPLWVVYTDYFADARAKVTGALASFYETAGRLPQDEEDMREALAKSGIEIDALRDPWGHSYYLSFTNETQSGGSYLPRSYFVYEDYAAKGLSASPRELLFNALRLRSRGLDGQIQTTDDFIVASFTRAQLEQTAQNLQSAPALPVEYIPGSTGAITGTIYDLNGATVTGAKVKATRLDMSQSGNEQAKAQTIFTLETESNDEGVYLLRNLPVGLYQIEITAVGFQTYVIDRVPVRSSNLTKIDNTLSMAGVSEAVTVTAESLTINATQSQLSVSYSSRQLTELPYSGSIDNLALLTPGVVSPGKQMVTPRLREYFPETLLWQPLLETDAAGRAHLSFKLADNITTWKMSVISSTVDGEVGIAEQEIKAFQPFFVEHDPPRVLTEGDQIQLPVVLRNYLAEAQAVDVTIKPEGWFTLLSPDVVRQTVAAGDSARAVFAFRASAAVKDGKQRITATGAGEASDAIEKPISVHPDGEELTETSTQLFSQTATLDANFPAETIKDSATVELKLYPNLMAHLIESIEGIMERPHGCGEQTISSTYPSLLALKAYKRSGISSPIQAKAERYLQLGYERLLNYRANGGFTYWGHGEADLALSAYALRFLNDAREFIAVDDQLLQETREGLVRKQRDDGSWPAMHYWSAREDAAETSILTAYIARVLAVTASADNAATTADKNSNKDARALAVARALDYLQPRVARQNEPYLISAYALAALAAREPQRATEAIAKLRGLARSDDEMSFWSSETGTPFYGWGLGERIETTALAVQALNGFQARESATTRTSDELANRGLLFLLTRKDRYGVWYTTQATINVLDALITEMSTSDVAPRTSQQNVSDEAEIFVNGRRATSVTMPPANQLSAPLRVDLSQYLAAGNNRITIRRPDAREQASVQLVQTYYVPWASPASTRARANEASRALRLAVSYDKTEAETGAEVTCKVDVQRTSGYGMLLAEIGLPPGADVDRASLEEAVKGSDWSLSHYDILPDRVVAYLWPRTSGTRFEFKFRMRYGLTAETAPSVIYDYYNPEARAVIAPTKFVVR